MPPTHPQRLAVHRWQTAARRQNCHQHQRYNAPPERQAFQAHPRSDCCGQACRLLCAADAGEPVFPLHQRAGPCLVSRGRHVTIHRPVHMCRPAPDHNHQSEFHAWHLVVVPRHHMIRPRRPMLADTARSLARRAGPDRQNCRRVRLHQTQPELFASPRGDAHADLARPERWGSECPA